MPAYNRSTTFYTDSAFDIYSQLPSNISLGFGLFSECGSEIHIAPSDTFLSSPEDASSPELFTHIPTTSPVSHFSTPQRTYDSESGEDSSSSGSNSDAEGEVDQGNWSPYFSQALKDL